MPRILWPLLAAFISLALLAPARAQEPPAYIALGDSLAFGVGAGQPEKGGYVALAFEALRRSDRYRERGLQLLNLAVPGATSSDLLLPGGQLEAALAEIGARQETPSPEDDVEIISIDIGGNDLITLGASPACTSDPLGPDCQERFSQMLQTLRENLTRVVRELRQAAPQATIVIIGLYNPYSGSGSSLEAAADIAIRQVNQVLADVAAQPELGARLASIYGLFQGRSGQWIADDGLHPNDDGHAVIAEALLAAIEGREPSIPQELREVPPQPAATAIPSPQARPAAIGGGDDGGTNVGLLLAIAIPGALLGGAIIGGAYLLARGRR